MTWDYRRNSLDALRLLAALQVAYLHAREYMLPGQSYSVITHLITLFPGVPIFFFISGYLITRSFERLQSLPDYSRNRALRIFPALWVCVAVNILMVAATGYFSAQGVSFAEVVTLFLAKSSFLQFYNPQYMRAFGDGVLNGSLWTICVELQFYLITPLLYAAIGALRSKSMLVVAATLVASLAFNRLLYWWEPTHYDEIWWKLLRVSFLPWIYMFLVGMLVQRNFEMLARFASKCPAWAALAGYIVLAHLLIQMGLRTGNECSPLIFILLVFLVFRFAYANPTLAHKVLRGNDVSYGLYIWHMPVINQMLFYGLSGSYFYLVFALLSSLVLAVMSWVLVEKPALQRKRATIREPVPSVVK